MFLGQAENSHFQQEWRVFWRIHCALSTADADTATTGVTNGVSNWITIGVRHLLYEQPCSNGLAKADFRIEITKVWSHRNVKVLAGTSGWIELPEVKLTEIYCVQTFRLSPSTSNYQSATVIGSIEIEAQHVFYITICISISSKPVKHGAAALNPKFEKHLDEAIKITFTIIPINFLNFWSGKYARIGICVFPTNDAQVIYYINVPLIPVLCSAQMGLYGIPNKIYH